MGTIDLDVESEPAPPRPRAVEALADLLWPERTIPVREETAIRALHDARLRLTAAALQGLLAGPVPEGADQSPGALGLVAVQHADAALWALLEVPCTHPEDDAAMLRALDREIVATMGPALRGGVPVEDVDRAVARVLDGDR